MEPILIPPTLELPYFGHGEMHLVLSHLLVDPRYRKHYHEEALHGAYLILDNSAHELGSGGSAHDLLEQAIGLRVQQIVCPDVLFKCDETLQSTEAALKYLVKETPKTEEFSLMIVPQGESISRWRVCLNELLRLYWSYTQQARSSFPFMPTVGLSKDYGDAHGGLWYIIKDHLASLKLPIHLLGWGSHWTELGQIATTFPQVRSVDTAKPFVAALSGIELDFKMNGIVPPRPDGYFNSALTDEQRKIASRNIGLYTMLANGAEVSWW